jgi:hypothetical protein
MTLHLPAVAEQAGVQRSTCLEEKMATEKPKKATEIPPKGGPPDPEAALKAEYAKEQTLHNMTGVTFEMWKKARK